MGILLFGGGGVFGSLVFVSSPMGGGGGGSRNLGSGACHSTSLAPKPSSSEDQSSLGLRSKHGQPKAQEQIEDLELRNCFGVFGVQRLGVWGGFVEGVPGVLRV